MTPRVGLPLAAGLIVLALVIAAAGWNLSTANRRETFRDRLQRPGSKGFLIGILIAGALGIFGFAADANVVVRRPIWFYVVFLLGVMLPGLVAGIVLHHWASKTHPTEWKSLNEGAVHWRGVSRDLRRSLFATFVVILAPGALLTFALFGRG